MRLWAATGTSIARLDESDGGWEVSVFLPNSQAQCLALDVSDPDTCFAGLREGGVRVTRDGGGTWEDCGLPQPGVFSLAVSSADGAVYAGCEPSTLFRSDDSGESWRELRTLLDLPSQPSWSFPPRPWTSHVRWIAPSPHDADLLLVGIELGGLMRSTDGGETWQDHRPGAQRDVHSLAWHPHAEGRAYEAGGGGAAFSVDAGETWRPADDGRDRHYTWSVAVDPEDPDVWFVSASTGPFAAHGGRDAQARIYRRQGGEPWAAVAEPGRVMPYALVFGSGRLFAALSDGRILESFDRGDTWSSLSLRGDPLPELHALRAV
jgi:BNR/Asp-box repeat